MDTLTFLQRVLPSTGYFCAWVKYPSGANNQKFFPTVEELHGFIQRQDNGRNNAYYAVSSFVEGTNRTGRNASMCRVIAFDLDVGKTEAGSPSYPTQEEAILGLRRYLAATKMPKPLVVSSGMGFHVYWVLEEELSPDRWQTLATAIKNSAVTHGLVIDPKVTGDIARVLRPVGTQHTKSGATVSVIMDAKPVAAATIARILKAPLMAASSAPRGKLNFAVDVEFPPTNAQAVVNKCKQIEWAVTHQEDVSEPMWYSLMGVAAFCHDAEEVAVAWSQHHPNYDEATTLKKLAQWKAQTTGPASCDKFKEERPDGCKGCKFAGKINTPARLGIQYEEAEVVKDAGATTPVDLSEIPLPAPFKRTKLGIKITVDESDIDVCPFDIYPIGYGRDEGLGYETVRYMWYRPHHGWKLLTLRQAMIAEGNKEFSNAIADQGIVLPGHKATELFRMLARSYMDNLRKVRAMSNLYNSMGWKENNTQFILGDTLIRLNADGSVTHEPIISAAGSARTTSGMYETAGTLEAWTATTAILDKARMPSHMFALGVAFSSPLFNFAGLKGMTVSLCGPTGSGKTLAQYWAQSVFGNPDRLHFQAKFTANAMYNRLAMHCHLLMTIDEVTTMADKDVGDFLYAQSQGREKARLTRTADEREVRTWATPLMVSTNKPMAGKVTSDGMDADAQLARLLEVHLKEHKLFAKSTDVGRQLYGHLMDNHGHAGLALITHLVAMGEAQIKALIAAHTEQFYKTYGVRFEGHERFWEQQIILADLASKIAKDLGLIAYDYQDGTRWVLKQIDTNRSVIIEQRVDAFDLIANYLNDNAGSLLTIMHTAGVTKPMIDLSRMPRADIRARYDVHRASTTTNFSHGTLMLDKAHLRRWLSGRGGDYKSFVEELAKEGILSTPVSGKMCLGKDTPIKVGQTWVVGVNLNHPRMKNALNDADDAAENLILGQLAVVKS